MKSVPSSPLTAQILKIIGIILLLSSLLDFAALAIPFRFQDKQWLLGYTTQMVDRGIIPLIGLGFLFAGFWFEGEGEGDARPNPFSTLRFWVLAWASLLGVVFLVLMPLHLNTTNQVLQDVVLKKINDDATTRTNQIEAQIKQEQSRISSLISNEEQVKEQLKQLDAAINSGQVKGPQLQQLQQQADQGKKLLQDLQQYKSNPGSLDAKAKDLRNQALTQIGSEKKRLEDQARTDSWKTGLRIGISSLLLALGYTFIGWSGLRELNLFSSRRK